MEKLPLSDMERLECEALLSTHPIFSSLSFEQLAWLIHQMFSVSLPAGTIIFDQGEAGEECYLIQTGDVEILFKNPDGSYHLLSILPPSSIFGEMAHIMKTPRNAAARTRTECKLFVFSGEVLRTVMGFDASITNALLDLISLRSRPMHAPSVETHRVKTSNQIDIVTLKQTELGHFFRLTPEGWFIWELCDGKHTLRDITIALFEKYDIFNPALVSNLIMDLDQAGFITYFGRTELNHKPAVLTKMRSIAARVRRVMEAKHFFGNVDAWLTSCYQNGIRWLYTPVAQIIFALIVVLGFAAFVSIFDRSILLMQSSLSAKWLLFVTIPTIMIVMILHEFAHAFTTKAFGHTVRGLGIGWFWVGPIAYCDTSDMWLASHWKRVAVDMAGIYLQFILGGIASFIAWAMGNDSTTLFLWYFALFNYLTIFTNLTPIIKLDGYYTLMDILDTPNLKEKAITEVAKRKQSAIKKPWSRFTKIYWIACFVYLLFDFFISYIVLRYLLEGLLHVTNPLISLAISFLIVFLTVLGLYGEVRQEIKKSL